MICVTDLVCGSQGDDKQISSVLNDLTAGERRGGNTKAACSRKNLEKGELMMGEWRWRSASVDIVR